MKEQALFWPTVPARDTTAQFPVPRPGYRVILAMLCSLVPAQAGPQAAEHGTQLLRTTPLQLPAGLNLLPAGHSTRDSWPIEIIMALRTGVLKSWVRAEAFISER